MPCYIIVKNKLMMMMMTFDIDISHSGLSSRFTIILGHVSRSRS